MNKSTPYYSYGYLSQSTYKFGDSPEYPYGGHGPYQNYWGDNVQVGSSDPHYRDKILSGQSATGTYYASRYDISPGFLSGRAVPFSWAAGTMSRYSGGYDTIPLRNVCDPDVDALVKDLAIGKLRNRLGNESQQFNSLVPLGEINELRALLAHGHSSVVGACTRLVTDLLNIKRAIRNPRRAFKAAQDAWLTFSFGIRPTLSDISALGNSINAFFNKPERTIQITGSASKNFKASTEVGSITGMYFSAIGTTAQLDMEVGYKYICGHRFKSSATNDYSLLDQLGFNLPNLVPAAWELIPYTWIVDYFSTAGQFLEDHFTSISGASIYIMECRRYSCESRGKPRFTNTDPDVNIETFSAREYFGRYSEFRRTPLASIPARSLRFKSLDEIGRNGVNRLLNLTALLKFGGRH